MQRWSIARGIDWRAWDSEFVVRSHGTGSTYLVAALAGATLEAMHQDASYLGEIAAHVFAASMPLSTATVALMASFAEANADAENQSVVLVDLEAFGLVRVEV